MADVHVLPGVERIGVGAPVPSADVLQFAIDNGVTDVVVVGRVGDGKLYVASDTGDIDAVIGKLHRAAHFLADKDLAIE